MLVLLRWVLIIATSYLLLFSSDATYTPPSVALFIAGYLASNLLLSKYFTRWRGRAWFDAGIVLFDIAAVAIGLSLTGSASVDFFPVFFLVIFIGALTERVELVVGAAALIGLVHLSTLSQFLDAGQVLDGKYMLRIPFLFVVALFFGFEAKLVRSRERSEKARERKRLATESLSAVTHDIKNPLSVIQSLANLLLDGNAGPLSNDQAGLVRRIHANVRRVLQLSGNLLDVARIEAGRLNVQRSVTDLRDVVEDSLALARSAAEIKGVALHYKPDPTVPKLFVDALQLERVASNLLDNAIKYTPPGGSVTVSTGADRDAALLMVKDDGPGIPTDEITYLFERYRRRAESNHIHGAGLGLFIVKAVVEAHGGTVDLASEVGSGTTVTVRIPTARADAEREAPATAAPAWDSPVQAAAAPVVTMQQ